MKKSFKPGTALSPVPAVMVSCGNGDEKNIITIAWTGIINSDPPLTYVSVRKSRHSHKLIADSKEFVINLVNEPLTFAADFCGVKSGRELDKFEKMNLTAQPADIVGCPMIAESPINLECRVVEVREYPTHDMFVAEIVNMHADESLIDDKGRIDFAAAGLVAYVHGEYFGIKKAAIGRFGYSIMKPKTKKRINKQQHMARVEKNKAERAAKNAKRTATAGGKNPQHAGKRGTQKANVKKNIKAGEK